MDHKFRQRLEALALISLHQGSDTEFSVLPVTKSNSNGSCQKWGVKCHFTTLNSVLALLNSVFAPMVGAKMGCHFNNLMFFY